MRTRIMFAAALMAMMAGWQFVTAAGAGLAGGSQPTRAWRYAYVSPDLGRGAEICFVEAAGCRLEVVPAKTDNARMSGGQIDMGKAVALAMTQAVATLGSAGWEMYTVGATFGDGAATSERALYFRRPE